jgi:hypothetical protein
MNDIKTFQFFTGGNATFTVSNNKGEHYTYKIRRREEGRDGKPTPFFVSLLSGPDNESSYTYLGIMDMQNDRPVVRLTAKSRLREDSKPVQVVRWALNAVRWNHELPPGYAIQHEGKCCRCGRTLTTPESIDRGIGPECVKHFPGMSVRETPVDPCEIEEREADLEARAQQFEIEAERAAERHYEDRGDHEEHHRDAISHI